MKKITLCFLALLPLLSVSCSKDDEPNRDITVEIAEQNLYFGDEYQIQASSNTPITYSSNDEYHAEVSDSGLVTARFVGETSIVLSNENNSKEIPIVVKPKSNLYPKPNLDFGISKSNLISNLGAPDAETEEGIAYAGYSGAAPMVMYLFDENDELENVGVLVKTLYSSELGIFLSERYLPADPENLIFVNALEASKITMLVGAELYNEEHWMVIYLPYSDSAKMNFRSKNKTSSGVDELYEQVKKIKKI